MIDSVHIQVQEQKALVGALLDASKIADVQKLKQVLAEDEAKKYVNVLSPEGVTPLMLSAQWGFADNVRLLLEHGADPTITDERGVSALMWSVWAKQQQCAQILLDRSDVQVQDKHGMNALHIAAQNSSVALIKMLLPYSVVNAKSNRGVNALMIACQTGNIACAQLLLEAMEFKSVLEEKDELGKTALDYAKKSFGLEGKSMVQYLEQYIQMQQEAGALEQQIGKSRPKQSTRKMGL